ncbi:MAG TPA: sodium:proton antiporter [Lachnospiraceae bacterium]|nr:sodium:proton antiporter [Lachnospiraceae bacterium]
MIFIFLFIVMIGIINERFIHLQSDIALVLFSVIFSLILVVVMQLPGMESFSESIYEISDFGFETYLLDGVLCFMLFAGASKVNMHKFKQNIKAISLLALLTTVISSAFYGLLFYMATMILPFKLDIWTCILLGCIVSPTDPIAATGILNKLGLSKNVTSVIENESLFNDGTGVALFVFVKSIVLHSGESNFLIIMTKELGGAILVAFLISFPLFRLLKLSKDPIRQILVSLLDVSLVYVVCEYFGFSGVIASVVCGMYFASKMESIARVRAVTDPKELYNDFWDVLDSILNAVLFVMIGISVLHLELSKYLLYLLPIGIFAVIFSRFVGVWIGSVLTGGKRIPSSYSLTEFVVLMTWSALKGGLSLALAMSTKEFLDNETYLIMLNVAYITIFFTVVVQGLTVSKVYRLVEHHKAHRIKKLSEPK